MYLCHIKKLYAISLAFFFLLAGTGIHIDLTYCCGELEGVAFFDGWSMDLEGCCGEDKTDNCMENDEVISEMDHSEFQLANILRLQPVSSDLLQISTPTVSLITANYNNTSQTVVLHPPPLRLMLQTFLC